MKSRPATTTRRNGSAIGAEGLCAPETHARYHAGGRMGVRREAEGSPSWAFTPMTCAAVFKAVASFLPRMLHVKPSLPINLRTDNSQLSMGALLCADKSFVEIRQTR